MPPRLLARIVPLLVALVVIGLQVWHRSPSPTTNAALRAAARAHASHVEVDARGRVTRLLPDDTEGARHQRFLVRVADGLTVLVAHNRDLAPHVPVQTGDSVALRGEYIWNDRGGTIHWTHHDPARQHEPGWIEYGGRRYE